MRSGLVFTDLSLPLIFRLIATSTSKLPCLVEQQMQNTAAHYARRFGFTQDFFTTETRRTRRRSKLFSPCPPCFLVSFFGCGAVDDPRCYFLASSKCLRMK